MHWDEQHAWNIIFTLVFGFFVVTSYIFLQESGLAPREVPLLDLVLMILAIFRLTRLFISDHITQWIRDLFLDVRLEGDSIVRVKPARGPRLTMATLFGCPWCFGIWSAFVVLYAYFLTPHAYFFILVFALAGMGTLLQILANLIGWHAELAKKSAESSPSTQPQNSNNGPTCACGL